jgi:hypothetical protein
MAFFQRVLSTVASAIAAANGTIPIVEYSATSPTLAAGESCNLQGDSSGRAKVSLEGTGVDKALRSALHTLSDSASCTAGAIAVVVDTSGTYTLRLLNDSADVTIYLLAGIIYAMEPKLIKTTGSPSSAKATLLFKV